MAAVQPAHVNLGARYDVEITRTPNQDNPLYPGRLERVSRSTPTTSRPASASPTRMDDESRSAIRGGFGLFYQRTSFTFQTPMFSGGRFSDSFTVQYPLNNADPGPRAGNFPTQPELANGPVVNRALFDARFPPGTLNRNIGTVRFDNPDRRTLVAPVQPRLRAPDRRDAGRRHRLHPLRAAGAVRAEGPQSGHSRYDRRHQQLVRNTPLVGAPGEFVARVETLVNDGWIDYNTVQVSMTQRQRAGFSGRVSYAYSRGRGNVSTGQADIAISQVLGDLGLENDEGPTNVDRPHILSVAGTYEVPRTRGLRVSGVYQVRIGHAVHARSTAPTT